MHFRFLEKKDGTKILQSKEGISNWKDVPLVKEQSLLDKAVEAIYLYESKHGDKPCGVMFGFLDHVLLELEMNERVFFRARPSGNIMQIMGIPVHKHSKNPQGVYLLQEVK
jgi:hypothetical protein